MERKNEKKVETTVLSRFLSPWETWDILSPWARNFALICSAWPSTRYVGIGLISCTGKTVSFVREEWLFSQGNKNFMHSGSWYYIDIPGNVYLNLPNFPQVSFIFDKFTSFTHISSSTCWSYSYALIMNVSVQPIFGIIVILLRTSIDVWWLRNSLITPLPRSSLYISQAHEKQKSLFYIFLFQFNQLNA